MMRRSGLHRCLFPENLANTPMATLVLPRGTAASSRGDADADESGPSRVQLPATQAAQEAAKYITNLSNERRSAHRSYTSVKQKFTLITGAGCSTESGIPDYRSKNGLYQRTGFKPLTADQFKKDASRRRYWARSFLGFHSMGHSKHNAVHAALDRMLREGLASSLVTQNVDGLHHHVAHRQHHNDEEEDFAQVTTMSNAGSAEGDDRVVQEEGKAESLSTNTRRTTPASASDFFESLHTASQFGKAIGGKGEKGQHATTTPQHDTNLLVDHHRRRYELVTQSPAKVVELHGNIHQVLCTGCGEVSSRYDLQSKLAETNANLIGELLASATTANTKGTADPSSSTNDEDSLVRPDGDFAAPEHFAERFQIPPCQKCGAHLKPNVVLFGENVKKEKVETVFQEVDDSAAIICVGTSLTVWSSYRFVDRAKKLGIPVVILNDGPTRGDDVCDLKIDEMQLGSVLPTLVEELLLRMS